ncbi:MAG: TetR family transcriptional regulator [Cypionkella sp.]|uniref:transcriptional regulator n=1 Tax=Cypionkella sp. TaxID=2811411 RepID=UPI002607AB7C|nr:transcriptional regulator [Cypionkella sp.]MDB5658834.1 TetR family transcriptional regulator [Cypionkella sp.]
MARTRLISDHDVFKQVLSLLLQDGEKSVTFSAISAATGLAPPTLVQRYGSCAEMISTAIAQAWDELDALAEAATLNATTQSKGLPGLLKALTGSIDAGALLTLSQRRPDLTARASAWRNQVEQAIAARLEVSAKAKDTAAMIFAAWQCRMLWSNAGGKGFRLGELIKRLG